MVTFKRVLVLVLALDELKEWEKIVKGKKKKKIGKLGFDAKWEDIFLKSSFFS